jgi:hypothetical protein
LSKRGLNRSVFVFKRVRFLKEGGLSIVRAEAKGTTARWFAETADSIQKDYERLHVTARNRDSQKAGNEAESAWLSVLKKWLPSHYDVRANKYIVPDVVVDPTERDCFQIDLVVFNPTYPEPLRDHSEVLSGGILAAFFVRLTLNAEGIDDASRRAAVLKRSTTVRANTPRMHLQGPFSVGLLAHSHDWKCPGSSPFDNTKRNLEAKNRIYAKLPREVLDFTCVADLALWTTSHSIQVGAGALPVMGMSPSQFQDGAVSVCTGSSGPNADTHPVARMVVQLIYRLGYVDPTLRHWSLGLLTALPAAGDGHVDWRHWDLLDVLPQRVVDEIKRKGFDNFSAQSDWQSIFA